MITVSIILLLISIVLTFKLDINRSCAIYGEVINITQPLLIQIESHINNLKGDEIFVHKDTKPGEFLSFLFQFECDKLEFNSDLTIYIKKITPTMLDSIIILKSNAFRDNSQTIPSWRIPVISLNVPQPNITYSDSTLRSLYMLTEYYCCACKTMVVDFYEYITPTAANIYEEGKEEGKKIFEILNKMVRHAMGAGSVDVSETFTKVKCGLYYSLPYLFIILLSFLWDDVINQNVPKIKGRGKGRGRGLVSLQ